MKLNDAEKNAFEALRYIVQLAKVKITTTSLKKALLEHPDFPSLSALNDVLTHFKVSNLAARIGPEQLATIPLPAVAHLTPNGGFFAPVRSVNGTIEWLDTARGWQQETLNDFVQKWDGVMLLIAPDQHSGEADYAVQRRKQLIVTKENFTKHSSLISIATSSGKLDDTEKGKLVLEKILELTKSFKDEDNQNSVLLSIAEAYGKLGDAEKGKQVLDKALEFINLIKEEGSQGDALLSIAEAYGKLGDAEKGNRVLEKTLELTKLIKEEDMQGDTLISIAEAYGKLGDAEKGKQVLEKTLGLMKSIKGEITQSYGLRSIAESSEKLGNTEKGKQVLEKALELTKSFKDEDNQNFVLLSIAKAYENLGDTEKGKQVLEKALELAKYSKNKYGQPDTSWPIAEAYLKLEDRTKVKEILSPILKTSVQSQHVAFLYAELGDWGEALYLSHQYSPSQKAAILGRILRVNAEQQEPELKKLRIKNQESRIKTFMRKREMGG